MIPKATLLLNRRDVSSLLTPQDYLELVENAFRLHQAGQTLPLGLLHVDSHDGEFHITAGGVQLERTFFGLKANGGFFQNRDRFGLPNIQGTILLCDGEHGYPLAILDSGAITIHRTGATTAVAAKYMARPDSHAVTICGCGVQGRIQLRYLSEVLSIERAFAWDPVDGVAEAYAAEMTEAMGFPVSAVPDLPGAIDESDVCVTCTPARESFLSADMVPPGMFVAAVGADSPDKQELEPALLGSSTVVADFLDQCAEVGELHHAIQAGVMTTADIHAELGEVVSGEKPGRVSEDEVTLFDATGSGLQDAAGAAVAYLRALDTGAGDPFNFFES
jgi:alanine dehydrogenase